MRKTIMLFGVLFIANGLIAQPNRSNTTDKFNALLSYISQFYVDSVAEDELTEKALVAMLEQLDPHSIYIPRKEVEAMNAPLKGNFDGVGIRYQVMKDTLMVVNPIPGGPSEKIGIRAGDKILTIDGENIAGVGIRNSQIQEKLRGPKGTKVTVQIMRRGVKDNLSFTISRDKIPLYSIDAAYMAAPEIGYIKLNSFGETTMSEFYHAFDSLQKQGMKSLIFDLQGNGGGYLNTAIDLCDEFLGGEKLIVFTEGRAFERRDVIANKKGVFETGKLVLLIDESSASASEILSGAVQDWDRGLIIGRRSFGKGLVQKPINLPDGSQVRLTTQRYYTPSGRCIQKSYEDGSAEYYKEKYQRYLSGEFFHLDSIKIPDSLKFKTKINKREVFGAGGIIPDIFVPIDTSSNSNYLSELLRSGSFNFFCLQYVDKNRKTLTANYPDFVDYKKSFLVGKDLMDEFIAYAEAEKIKFNEADFALSKHVIEVRLKAGIASNLWDYGMFYEIINELNPIYIEAIKSINGSSFKDYNIVYNEKLPKKK